MTKLEIYAIGIVNKNTALESNGKGRVNRHAGFYKKGIGILMPSWVFNIYLYQTHQHKPHTRQSMFP